MGSTDRVTVWGNPSDSLASEYGVVSYFQWCEKEMARMNRVTEKVRMVVRESDKFVCLAKA